MRVCASTSRSASKTTTLRPPSGSLRNWHVVSAIENSRSIDDPLSNPFPLLKTRREKMSETIGLWCTALGLTGLLAWAFVSDLHYFL